MSEYYADTLAPDADAEELFDEQSHIQAAQAGDEVAFAKLYAHHFPKLLEKTYRLAGNYHDAEDIAQEACTRVYKSLGAYEDKGKDIGGYFYITARNVFFDLLRKRNRHPETDFSFQEDYSKELIDDEQRPDIIIEQDIDLRDRMATLRQMIGNEAMAEVVFLAAADWEYQDIAEKQGVSIGTVKSRLNRARTRLLKCAGQYDLEAPEDATFGLREKVSA